METLPLLDKVATDLAQHENSMRIRKLIYCLCKNSWENDKNKLAALDLKNLVKELQAKNPTSEHLKMSLFKIVKTLNKPGEYTAVAKIIFTKVGQLYPEPQKPISENLVRDHEPTAIVQSSDRAQTIPKLQPDKKTYDVFDVRQSVMNYVNPLIAKILLFSIIERKFNFSNQDWVDLRYYQLDDLLKRVFDSCDRSTEFEETLQSVAKSLQYPEEHTKVANAIIKLMKPFFSPTQLDPRNPIHWQGVNMIADDNENTCQFIN